MTRFLIADGEVVPFLRELRQSLTAVGDFSVTPEFDTWDQSPPGLRLPTGTSDANHADPTHTDADSIPEA